MASVDEILTAVFDRIGCPKAPPEHSPEDTNGQHCHCWFEHREHCCFCGNAEPMTEPEVDAFQNWLSAAMEADPVSPGAECICELEAFCWACAK